MTTATATQTRYTLDIELGIGGVYDDGNLACEALIYKSIPAGISAPVTDLTIMRAAATQWEQFVQDYGFEIANLDSIKTNYRGNTIMTYTLTLK